MAAGCKVSRHAWESVKRSKKQAGERQERQTLVRARRNAARPIRPARRTAQGAARGAASSGRLPDDGACSVGVGALEGDGGARLQIKHQLAARRHKLHSASEESRDTDTVKEGLLPAANSKP